MRHAKSDWSSNRADIDRPLNVRGCENAIRMGAYLKQMNLAPDKMVVSAAQRTQETADLLLNALKVADEDIIIDKELYLADRETLCDVIELYSRDRQRLLILAHNPGMDYLVNYLASEPPTLTSSGNLMPTCAVAYFHMKSVDALNKQGRGELKGLFRPKEIFDIT